MVGDHSMRPGLQLVGARFFNFLLWKAITRVQTSPFFVDISRNSNGRISVVRDATVTCLGTLVLYVLCMLV